MLRTIENLTALDGRYAKEMAPLAVYFSEKALIARRIQVEIEYLIALSEEEAIKEVPPLPEDTRKALRALYEGFSGDEALKVKDIEDKCQHDVKSVEYYLTDRFTEMGLEQYIPFIHIGLTSEDVNNISYP